MSRTVVGSWPRRRTLPMGREAIERALAMCERWGTGTPAGACDRATRTCRPVIMRHAFAFGASWLPVSLLHMSIAELAAALDTPAEL